MISTCPQCGAVDYEMDVCPRCRQHDVASLGAVAIRTSFRIAERWGLSAEEQQRLFGVSFEMFDEWRAAPPEHLSREQLERVSHVFGIYKALATLIPDPAFRDSWIRQSNRNSIFDGHPPLARMLEHAGGLELVRSYLEAELEA